MYSSIVEPYKISGDNENIMDVAATSTFCDFAHSNSRSLERTSLPVGDLVRMSQVSQVQTTRFYNVLITQDTGLETIPQGGTLFLRFFPDIESPPMLACSCS